jgi:methylamine dehydrogenase accessory protein MauD
LVFAVAGVAKLADRAGSRRALIDFDVPTPLAAPLAILLPLAELAVAAALIPASTAFWGALGALALLLVFVGAIGFNLVRGHKPHCRCFGQIHSAPAGWNTLARNAALAAIAGFVVWQGYDGGAGPSVLGLPGELSVVQLAGLVGGVVVLGLLAAQWWLLLNMMGQNGRLLVRLKAVEEALASGGLVLSSPNGTAAGAEEGLPLGSPAPEFELPDLSGRTLSLGSLRSPGKPILLLFTDPECGPCNALLPEVGRLQKEHAQKLTLVLVSRGDPEENRRQADEHGLTNVVLQAEWEVSKAYGVRGTPSAVLVLPGDSVGSPVAGGSEAIKSLVGRAAQGHLAR